MNTFDYIFNCRICKNNILRDVISLGEQKITSRFPKIGDNSIPITPIDLCMCENCGLLQLKQTTLSSELYEFEYGYRSGINNTMKKHLKLYQEEISSKIFLDDNDLIIDIGSNDSTMLQYYSKNLKRLGIDPTGKQFKEYYGDVALVENYFTKENFLNSVYGNLKPKIVSSISMFYDLPDPVQFAKDIYDILDDEGIWTCEQSYLITMLKQNSFDTICHEHLEYYSLHQIKEIADRSNFKIIDVKFNDCNGGSFRIYFAKNISKLHIENIELINNILKDEDDYGINSSQVYIDFMKRCDNEIKKLCDFIDYVNENNKQIWLYGASTKGNCLLQYANLTSKNIKYAVERNLKKVGKMTSTGIEIISEDMMRKNPPDYLLVLPWHFKNEMIEREKDYLNNGGQFVFPLPNLEIVGNKKKILITGCDGHISHYLKDQLKNNNYLYGITKNNDKFEKCITKFFMNLKDKDKLEYILSIIKPDVIIHMASISSSIKAFHNPIDTLITNGLITAYICDIIHKNKWPTKLFNASSSEIYKGHINYTVNEDDTHMFHLHPYSIAKIISHSIIEFYRNTFNLPFSNGIIFTTESIKKSEDFLLNKVKKHAKEWKNNKNLLKLGNLDSYRNILHASDVSNAITTIIEQEIGDSYLICNEYSIKIYDLVLEVYKNNSIELIKNDNFLIDNNTKIPVIYFEELLETDIQTVNIKGNCEKLKKIGWFPKISLDMIINE